MSTLLAFAISFCASHVSVLIELITDVANLLEAHTQDVVKNPQATAILNSGIDIAAAKAIAAVAAKAHAVQVSNGSSDKSPGNHK